MADITRDEALELLRGGNNGVADWNRRRDIVTSAVSKFNIKVAGADQPVDELSGGNQQKVLVGRWMEHRPKVLILDEPTRGVDVGAREEIFSILGKLAQDGVAILLISSDLEEVMGVSHRIGVYRDGRLMRTLAADETTSEEVMTILTGSESDGIG